MTQRSRASNYGGSLDVILDDAKRRVGSRSHDRRRRPDRRRPRRLPRLGDRAAPEITSGLDEVINVGEIVEKSAPVNGVVTAINEQLDAGVDLLEGLLVKKAGMVDAGLVEGLYAGSAAAGFRSPREHHVKAPRIGEVYTQGTLTLARLGREAPIAVGNPAGPRSGRRRASPLGFCIRRPASRGRSRWPGRR